MQISAHTADLKSAGTGPRQLSPATELGMACLGLCGRWLVDGRRERVRRAADALRAGRDDAELAIDLGPVLAELVAAADGVVAYSIAPVSARERLDIAVTAWSQSWRAKAADTGAGADIDTWDCIWDY